MKRRYTKLRFFVNNIKKLSLFQILEPRDPNNGNHSLQEAGLGIENNMETDGNDILNISSSKYSNIPSKLRSSTIGPTAESALYFNTNACINFPNDNQFSAVCKDGINPTMPSNSSLQTSSWSQSVAKFRQQQELQRNLLIVKKQQAAAAAQTQQHGFIRQQNNLSHKRLLYQNSGFGLIKTIPPPPPPPPPPQNGLITNGFVTFDSPTNSEETTSIHQIQQNKFTNALKNNAVRSLDTTKVYSQYLV